MTKNKIGNSFAESGPKRSVGIGKGISKIKVGINEKAHRDIQNFMAKLDDSDDMTDEDKEGSSSDSDTQIRRKEDQSK